MGVKISEATLAAAAQLADEFPMARSGTSLKLNIQKVLDLAATQGFITGDTTAMYAINTSDDAKWQIGQKNTTLTIVSGSPSTITPDCAQANTFFVAPSTSELELQAPINTPSIPQLGGNGGNAFHFRIYARNGSAGNGGFVSFDSSYVKLPGSKDYTDAGTNRLNIIDVWRSGGVNYYRIDNDTYAPGQARVAEITVPSAEVLTANATPVELIAAPGAGKYIAVKNLYISPINGTTPYTDSGGSHVALVGFGSTANECLAFLNTLVTEIISLNGTPGNGEPLGDIINTALKFYVANGELAAGDYDLYFRIDYEILDSPI